MVSSRSQSAPNPVARPRPRHRANPMGLGRLLIMAVTVGLIFLGHGLFWWVGLLLLALILLAVSRHGAWWGAWAASAGLLSIAFWHRHIVPVGAAVVILALGGLLFVWSLLRPRTD